MKLFHAGGLAVLFCALALTAVSSASAASTLRSDTVVSCSGYGRFGAASYGDLSVRNMSCRRGRRLLAQGYLTSSGKVRVPRYSCRLIGLYGDGGIYRCTRGRYALRVSIGG